MATANRVKRIIDEHIKDGGLVTGPDRLADKLCSPDDSPEIVELVKAFAWAVMCATKKEGMSTAANKRESAACRRLLKKILGREPTDAELEECTPG